MIEFNISPITNGFIVSKSIDFRMEKAFTATLAEAIALIERWIVEHAEQTKKKERNL